MKKSLRITICFLIALGAWLPLSWMSAEILIVEKPLEKADAIFVLGGSTTYVERNQKAAALYKQGIAPKILLTDDGLQGGWDSNEQRNPYYVELGRRELISQGVPENFIETLPAIVDGTKDEAELFVRTAREKNITSVLLVTSAYHTRRALRTFEKVSADSNLKTQIGIRSAPFGQQTPPPFYWWLSPSGWNMVAGEYVKIFYYLVYY
ncbi:MAG: YdcF family protein [Acidobacteria bacterium]|jgi:uncharacterized SAM-binding protein YcdF (DUF218 family)|nr:YdcF family protein [Acidobacteriota bacterium]